MKISLSLPSLHEDLVTKALIHIQATTQNFDVEVVVVSPFAVDHPLVTWVEETKPTGNLGAHNAAYEAATGEIFIIMVDDMLPEAGWLDATIAHLLAGEARTALFVTGIHQTLDQLGTVYGIYYPFFAATRRTTVEAVGGLFSSEFKAHCGDPDFALRVWQAGGRCEPCFDAKYIPIGARELFDESAHRSSAMVHDFRRFTDKWADSYGLGWPTNHPRDYSLNIYGMIFDLVLEDGTIFMNDPRFGEMVRDFYDKAGIEYMKVP